MNCVIKDKEFVIREGDGFKSAVVALFTSKSAQDKLLKIGLESICV
jgi:hypothetical protein